MAAPLPSAIRIAVVQAYGSGRSSFEIAREFGISDVTVRAWCFKAGVPIKPRGCKLRGPLHPTWKGGQRIDREGYLLTYAPDHPWPRSKGYIREHIRVMELHIKRRITDTEVVHHIDHDRQNNVLTNLRLQERGEHSSQHRLEDGHFRNRDAYGRFA